MPKPPLTIVAPGAAAIQPPRKLGSAGASLWRRIMDEYAIGDSGGHELLCLACEAIDRASQLSAAIEQDGVVIRTRTGGLRQNPCVKDELGCRALAAKLLEKLGVTVANVQSPGRPGGLWSS